MTAAKAMTLCLPLLLGGCRAPSAPQRQAPTHVPLPIPGQPAPDPRPLRPGEPVDLTRLAVAVTRTDPANGAMLSAPDWPRIPTTRLLLRPHLSSIDPADKPRALAVVAVRRLRVTDSTGRDLVAPLLDDGRPEPLTRFFHVDPAGALHLAVDAPAPSASSIDVALEVELSVCDRVISLDIPSAAEWTPLRHPSLEGLDVAYICRGFSEDSSRLGIRPRHAQWRVLQAGIPSPSGLTARLRPPQGFDSSGFEFVIPQPFLQGAPLRVQLAHHQRTLVARFEHRDIPLP